MTDFYARFHAQKEVPLLGQKIGRTWAELADPIDRCFTGQSSKKVTNPKFLSHFETNN